ncbi:hypothetical protein HMPREF0379_0027 [[Eubacterium] yurii subsp. margaretiae ATCC 43715]|nr:hypothetical protein HMPREF0379_0027 [[Eubacterium] yurii subsp. margaretiae ATCC 43715]
MKQTKKFSRKFSLLTIFMLLMSIISMDVYAAKIPFTDVPEKSWYYDDVKSAYELNLINGKKPTKYAPDDNMTAAEAVKLAAAMHMLKNEGKVNFTSSKPWYKVYVDYAKQKNLITTDLDWNKNITRAGYMQIFAQILTDEEAKKNEVADGSIPDVPMTHPNAQAIYKLYRAGVVVGVDDKKNCSPASNIKRSEVAAILVRMMDVKRRIAFSLGEKKPGTTPPPSGGTTPPPSTNPLRITKQPQGLIGKEGDVAVLEVVVEGGKQPYRYQWQSIPYFGRRDTDYENCTIAGSTTSIIKPAIIFKGMTYRCVITDANGDKVISNDATLKKPGSEFPLRFTKQPQGARGKQGDIVTLEVEAMGGNKPYSYQWQSIPFLVVTGTDYENCTIEGSTTNIIKPAISFKSMVYRCIVTDANGDKVISKEATLRPDDDIFNPLSITKQPESVVETLGKKVTLEVQVDGGSTPYKYHWERRKVGHPNFKKATASGNTTNILRPTVSNDAYDYRCVITDNAGRKVTSNEARVEKVPAPAPIPLTITKEPDDAIDIQTEGEEVTLEVVVEGGKQPYSYQWEAGRLDGPLTPTSGSGSSTSIFKPKATKVAMLYRCVITDADGNKVTSRSARVDMDPTKNPFIIAIQPIDVEGNVGDTGVLAVLIWGGKEPYNYEWFVKKSKSPDGYSPSKNPGSNTHTVNVVVQEQSYDYMCVIKDEVGNKLATNVVHVRKK